MDIRTLKNDLRAAYAQKRKAIPPEMKAELDGKIADNFRKMISYKHASQILFYASTDAEISTDGLFASALSDGKACFFPKCYEHSKMDFFRVYDSDGLASDAFNIRAPRSEAEIYTSHPSDIIIVPAMAYDKKGFRLGYGKGFYDRFLPNFMGIKIGLCYSDFISKTLPRGRYDVSVDILITEEGVVAL